MPALSPTMEEGTLAKWQVKVGDKVKSGDVIAEIETDKATMEVEAVDEGVVEEILVAEGTEEVKVNTPIARLSGEGAPRRRRADARTGSPSLSRNGAPAPRAPACVRRPRRPQRSSRPRRRRIPEIPAGRQAGQGSPSATPCATPWPRRCGATTRVFLMGEEVAQYQGAYKVSRDLLQEFGDAAGDRHPDHRARLRRPRRRRGHGGPEADRRVHDLQLRHAGDRSDYQFGRQDPLHVRRPDHAARSCSAAPTARPPASPPSTARTTPTWYGHVPGLKVVAPYDAADAKGLLKAAIRDPNPVVFLEHEMLYGHEFDVPEGIDWVVPIGKAKVRRDGDGVTITAHSRMVGLALEAAEELANEGIEAEVIDLRTLRPLDHATVVESVKKTNRLVTVEEGWGPMGVGAEVAARVVEHAFDYLDAPPARVHQEDVPLPYAANLEALSLPSVEKIVKAAKAVCYR